MNLCFLAEIDLRLGPAVDAQAQAEQRDDEEGDDRTVMNLMHAEF